MREALSQYYQRYFGDPESMTLLVIIAVMIALFATIGNLLFPIVISVILAYVLEGMVQRLQSWRLPRLAAVLISYGLALGLILWAILWLLPLLWDQLAALVAEMPRVFSKGQVLLQELQARFPQYVSNEQLAGILGNFKTEIGRLGQMILSISLSSISGVLTLVVYALLVPLLVFFFLKDSPKITAWLSQYLPRRREALTRILAESNVQIGNYVRGRIIEIVAVGAFTAIAFVFLGLQYAILLGALVGVAVIIPYVGATLVTIPIVVLGLMQWGWSAHFASLMIAYGIIQIIDGNVLVPLLFSETMDLHPVTIILAILIFGGLWGFWGVFFAIPLASVLRVLMDHWPRVEPNEGT